MKLKHLIKNINKTIEFENKIFIGDFSEKAFGLYIQNWDDQTRLTSYYLMDHCCTDTRVGYKVYFFDNKPVAVSFQKARKCDEFIEWISKKDYNKVKKYIMSFEEKIEDDIPIANLEKDFSTHYKIHYYEQMFKHHKNNAIYNNETVEVINYRSSFNDGNYNPETVQIKYSNGKKEWIETKLLSFPLNIKKY